MGDPLEGRPAINARTRSGEVNDDSSTEGGDDPHLDGDLLAAIEEFAACIELPRGSELFRQGLLPAAVYLIRSGTVKLTRGSGREIAVVGIRTGGWIAGAPSAILGEPYAVTASTATRCGVHQVTVVQFQRLIQENAAFTWRVLQNMSRDIREHTIRTADLACLSARARLERFLVKLAQSREPSSRGRVRVELPLRHWEIAQLIGVSPPYLSELMSHIEEDAIVERTGKWMLVDLSKITTS